MTQKANPSINRPAEAFKTAGAIAYGGVTDEGFISPANSPTEISVQDGGINEGQLNAFDETSSGSSLDVTIDGGEAFVFGSWLAIDSSTTVSLDADTDEQTVSVGWNKNGSDDVIVGLDAAFSSASGDADQKIPLFSFDTDDSGVTNVVDERSFDQIAASSVEQGAGSGLDADTVDGQEAAALGANAGDNLSKSGNTLDVVDGSGSGLDADTVDGLEAGAFVEESGDTMTGDLDMDSNEVVGLNQPTQDDEAARKAYVDATAEGLEIKEAVRVCTCGQGNIDLSSSTDPNPIDTVTLNDGDRILLIEQTDATENGIYEAVDADDPTTWVRTTDANDDADVNSGMFVLAVEGSESGNVGFVLITPNPIDVGVTPLNFTRFSGAESIEAGDNLQRTGSRLDVSPQGSGSGLDADSVDGIQGDDITQESTGGVEFPSYQTKSDVPNSITDGDVVYVQSEGTLFLEDGT